MLQEKSSLFSESLNLFYSSNNRVEALTDTEMFFPELFQVNFMSLIAIPSKIGQNKDESDNNLEVPKKFFYIKIIV